ncbi:hypothetical protein EAO73_08350 [Streptomyces sp. col6]|nr:hypothetical protein EAO73_08350 [Streptomyces sp. col6]
MTADTSRSAPPTGQPAASAAVRSVKFCVRAAHTGVTQKYDVGMARHVRNGCVGPRIWEAA